MSKTKILIVDDEPDILEILQFNLEKEGFKVFTAPTEEKESGQKIVRELKDVGVAVKDLLASEKEKLDEGKYDGALEKIGGLFEKVKNGVEKISPEAMDRLNKLERRRKDLAEEVEEKEQQNILSDEEKEKLNDEMKKLLRDTERLLNEISEE
ncbi:MAG: hypothetical protein AAFO82_16015 [Bacteroidota bacterium]